MGFKALPGRKMWPMNCSFGTKRGL